MDARDGRAGLTPEQRAAYRSFVRTHHPDRGGDPEVFRAGLARYRALAAGHAPGAGSSAPHDDRRYDAPIEIVPDMPLPTRVLVALIRTVRRRTHPRVDRPGRSGTSEP
ncbi:MULTISPECIES: hypothetical protein [Pseudonocardia]|uniref:J domain-containing protein n=2 Tax=Pseudonocardia TaxID=1847 RepID=A0A1Y2MYZ3_PSEAH|nr:MULTISPECIES: hypothetical protein [Pseudonocardia]OSY40434.1 hypothetical protein BG845_02838 [Pseudonocardia autotrophica]TDN72237.1 hypothetical protein C8E95_1292 [Pseudonocardia autotrophica]BBG02947.1 hypothetical protein Pdca_41560 [Pseudonocardia autotrophica]GEC25152.1 hypothetical protein PSA01_21810 [Pseudonocardia saturnea]